MAGGNFMNRVVTYVVNELLVDRLANSPAFQRFAVRTSKKIDDMKNMAEQVVKEISENTKSKNQ